MNTHVAFAGMPAHSKHTQIKLQEPMFSKLQKLHRGLHATVANQDIENGLSACGRGIHL